VEVGSNEGLVRWERVPSAVRLDEARFLGVRSEIPPSARPGDWCTVVLYDEYGEMQWTLVAVEPERESSIEQHGSGVRRRTAATGGGTRAPLGGALRRLPQSGESVPPSGSGLTARPSPLESGEGGATGRLLASVPRGR
jgi:hypothetical protein